MVFGVDPNDPQPFEVARPYIELTKQGEVVAVDRLAREALAFLLLNIPLRNETWVQDEAGLLVAKLRASVRAEDKSSAPD